MAKNHPKNTPKPGLPPYVVRTSRFLVDTIFSRLKGGGRRLEHFLFRGGNRTMAPPPPPVFFDELFESDVIFGVLGGQIFWLSDLLKKPKKSIFFEKKFFQKVFGRHFHWILAINSYKIVPESSKKDAFSGTTYMGVHPTPTPLRGLNIRVRARSRIELKNFLRLGMILKRILKRFLASLKVIKAPRH